MSNQQTNTSIAASNTPTAYCGNPAQTTLVNRVCICKWDESQSQQPPAQKPLVSSVMLDFPMVKHTATATGQWFILPTKIISRQQSCFKPKCCTFISSNPATVQNYKPNTMVEFIQREYGGCSLPYWPDASAQKNLFIYCILY